MLSHHRAHLADDLRRQLDEQAKLEIAHEQLTKGLAGATIRVSVTDGQGRNMPLNEHRGLADMVRKALPEFARKLAADQAEIAQATLKRLNEAMAHDAQPPAEISASA